MSSAFSFGAPSDQSTDFKLKFPHGLLGDDYGILTLNDLELNACYVRPRPFDPDASEYYPYEYWRCFKSQNVLLSCDSNGIPDKYEGVLGLIVIKVSVGQEQNEYINSRFWPIKECKGFLKDAATLLKGTEHVCISGSFIKKEKKRAGHSVNSWIFGRMKTKKGCEGKECVLTDKAKLESCPDL
jgi:hypothetical protein